MTRDRTGLDESTHRGPVTDQSPPLKEPGVSMSVEVDQGELTKPVDTGDTHSVGPCNRVITSEDDGDLAGIGDVGNGVCNLLHRFVDLTGVDENITNVDHPKSLKRVNPGWEMGPVAIHRPVVGSSNGGWAEPGTRSKGGSPVERRTEDDHVFIAEFTHRTSWATEERTAGRKREVLG